MPKMVRWIMPREHRQRELVDGLGTDRKFGECSRMAMPANPGGERPAVIVAQWVSPTLISDRGHRAARRT